MSEGSGNVRGGHPRRQLSDEVASYVRELIMSGNLRPGDFIRQVNGTPIVTVGQLAALLANPAATWTLVIERNGQQITAQVRV